MRPHSVGKLLAIIVAFGGCVSQAEPGEPLRSADTALVEETFLTPFDTVDNVDSPAIYHGQERTLVFASAKTSDVIIVYDGATGEVVQRLGRPGARMGELSRPNGVVVADSILFVVERDNHRVQAFHLPSLQPLGFFGAAELRQPYGLAWTRRGAHGWTVYVTDNYEAGEDSIPPDRELGARVRQYDVSISNARVSANHTRAFGDTVGDGVLRIVESIAADSALNRLLIAEENETDSYIKVYDLEGRFTGRVVGRGLFPQQAEGVALYACGATNGYWIATDQGETVNTFHVFDRASLNHLGAFTGARTRLTDGLTVTSKPFGPFLAGAAFASHLDGGLAALSWQEIAAAVGLPRDCDR